MSVYDGNVAQLTDTNRIGSAWLRVGQLLALPGAPFEYPLENAGISSLRLLNSRVVVACTNIVKGALGVQV